MNHQPFEDVQDSQLKFTMLENAHCYVNEALVKALVAEREPKEWKFAFVSLVQAVELLLKERLRLEAPDLIICDMPERAKSLKPATRTDTTNNTRPTVSLKEAIKRLKDHGLIQLSRIDQDMVAGISELRNQITHSEFDVKADYLKQRFAWLLGFIASFHHKQLGQPLNHVVSDRVWLDIIRMPECGQQIATRAQADILSMAIDKSLISMCKVCEYDSFIQQSRKGVCYVDLHPLVGQKFG